MAPLPMAAAPGDPELPDDLKDAIEQKMEGTGAEAKATLVIKEALDGEQIKRLKELYGNKPAIDKNIDKAVEAVGKSASVDTDDPQETPGEG